MLRVQPRVYTSFGINPTSRSHVSSSVGAIGTIDDHLSSWMTIGDYARNRSMKYRKIGDWWKLQISRSSCKFRGCLKPLIQSDNKTWSDISNNTWIFQLFHEKLIVVIIVNTNHVIILEFSNYNTSNSARFFDSYIPLSRYCHRLVERRNTCTIIFSQIEPVRFYFTKVAGTCVSLLKFSGRLTGIACAV